MSNSKGINIGIDARFYGSIGKGLGRYTQKLIENLEKVESANPSSTSREYFVFLREENFNEYQPSCDNFHKIKADYRWYSISEQINMPRLLNKFDLDLVHFPHFNVPLLYRKKFVITIHDLILIHFPTLRSTSLNPLFYWLKFLAYKIVIKSAIKRAEKIIAVSKFTKNDILDNYDVAESRLAVTYEACEDFCTISSESSESILRKYAIIKPYILYVGNAYPHKNLEALVLAFAKILKNKSNLTLVLVGRKDYFYQRLENLVKEENIENVVFAGYVPDEDLDTVYRFAELYIFPSLYEGFGLPPLEAMAKGVPVASSDHACMQEVLGEGAHFFDGKNIESMQKSIEDVLNNNELRQELIKKGYEQIKKYNWENMAKETLTIYLES